MPIIKVHRIKRTLILENEPQRKKIFTYALHPKNNHLKNHLLRKFDRPQESVSTSARNNLENGSFLESQYANEMALTILEYKAQYRIANSQILRTDKFTS